MHMKTLAVIFLLIPTLALADMDSQFSLGLGTQYGGAAGLKYSLSGESDKFYIGAGRADFFDRNYGERYGITLGWERLLSDNHAIGIAVRTRTDPRDGAYITQTVDGQTERREFKSRYDSFIAGTYTYYLNSATEAGFLTGVSVGATYYKSNVRSSFRSDPDFGVFFGYQF